MSTGRWTIDQIAALVVERVTDVDEAATWVAVVLAESGGNPVAYNLVDEDPDSKAYLSTDNGLFQINSFWHGARLPVHQANRPELAWFYAWQIATNSGGHASDWSPWTAYRNGSYRGETVIEFSDGEVVAAVRLDDAYDAVMPLLDEGGDVTRYPYGYGTGTMTMTQLRARYEPKMHPEFARRLFVWLEAQGGTVGIGGGWRDTQPNRPGFAPDGKSFHQTQTWASGTAAYAAVDLVVKRDAGKHRAPTWSESEDAPDYGLHTFIKNPPEPWHMQPIETRGWQSWVNAGRLDPDPDFVLPGDEPATPPEPTPLGEPMYLYRHEAFADWFVIGAGALHMSPDLYPRFKAKALEEIVGTDLTELNYVCNAAGFDYARLTPI